MCLVNRLWKTRVCHRVPVQALTLSVYPICQKTIDIIMGHIHKNDLLLKSLTFNIYGVIQNTVIFPEIRNCFSVTLVWKNRDSIPWYFIKLVIFLLILCYRICSQTIQFKFPDTLDVKLDWLYDRWAVPGIWHHERYEEFLGWLIDCFPRLISLDIAPYVFDVISNIVIREDKCMFTSILMTLNIFQRFPLHWT